MKKISMSLQLCLLVILIANLGFAQSDESRQATGLPMKVGENVTNAVKGNVSGKITLEGYDTSQPIPNVFVSAVVNGIMVDRRRASDSGHYYLPEVPRENVTLIVEVNGEEVGRQQLMSSVMGSLRQDFNITMAQWKSAKNKTGVISVKSLYSRSADNEKLFEKASAAAKEKNLDNAINLFKQIVANDAKDFVAWTELGTLYFRSEKYKDSEAAYIKALEQNIEFMLALMNLGKLYLGQKHPDNAILILTKAVEVEPTSADAQYYLGEAHLLAKKGSKAVVYLNEALKLAPIEKAEIHLRLATLYSNAGLKDKAVEEYKQFLQKVPNHPDKEKLEKYIKENSPK